MKMTETDGPRDRLMEEESKMTGDCVPLRYDSLINVWPAGKICILHV